jgi:hypothetical protein
MNIDSSNSYGALVFDPYEVILKSEKFNRNLIPFDNSTKFAKKINKLKISLANAKNNAMQGAMMGFMVGGLFGLCLGVYTAFQTRRFMAIPISALISGCSFGFILGCGSMIRTDELISNK